MHTDRRQEEALFRYGLIAPLLDPLSTEEEKRRHRKEVTSREHLTPWGQRRRVDQRTLRRWVQAYDLEGFSGLMRLERSDRGQARRLKPEWVQEAAKLKQQDPSRSIRQIIRILVAANVVKPGVIAPSTLWRHLHRLGLSRREPPPRAGRSRFEAPEPNAMWQGDATPGPAIPNPHHPDRMLRLHLLAFIDDHSRLCCHAQFFPAEDLYALELCLQQAILRRGIPKRIYVDHGMIFQAKVFTRACAELGIRHISSTVGRPEGRGKIERFFQTVQHQFLSELRHHPVDTLDAINRRLEAWIEEVYHREVHSETQQAPAERFGVSDARRRTTAERLAQVFLWRENRRADKYGQFRFDGNRYEVPTMELRRRRIEVRFHPLRLDELQVWVEGAYVGQARVVTCNHTTHRALNPQHQPVQHQVDTPPPYLDLVLTHHEARKRSALSPLRLALDTEEGERDV